MSVFVPTARVTIKKPTKIIDEFGEETTDNVVSKTGVPVAIIQTVKRVYAPSEQRLTTITTLTLRARPGTNIEERDTIVDETTGYTYTVTSVSAANKAVTMSDIRADIMRVS